MVVVAVACAVSTKILSFAFPDIVVFVLPVLAGVVFAVVDIAVDAVVASTPDIAPFRLLHATIQRAEFQWERFASPVVIDFVFDRIPRVPIRWWEKSPCRRPPAACYVCWKAVVRDATAFAGSPDLEFPLFLSTFGSSLRNVERVCFLDLYRFAASEPTTLTWMPFLPFRPCWLFDVSSVLCCRP